MAQEVLDSLQLKPGGLYIDCTVNGGGHALGILEGSSPGGRLLGLDVDPTVLATAEERLAAFGHRCTLRVANFRRLAEVARQEGIKQAHGVLFDLGLSTWQLEASGRGFSFLRDEPLDMRFDPTGPVTAAQLLDKLPEEQLLRIFREFGEEPRSAAVARSIGRRRRSKPITTTFQLVEVVEEALGSKRGRTHPATRTFQALRIAVNQELEALREGLTQAVEILAPAGRLVVISFHSLEDRIVKAFFRQEAGLGLERLEAEGARRSPSLGILTKKPLTPSRAEAAENPRSRSAKLRAVEKVSRG